jgi:nickel/cobalt exporter
VLFGLTGSLIPCPAAITVLLLCIQLKQFSLGPALVVCFGIGLAATMVSAGVLAALSVKQAASRWSGFGAFARQAPYASVVLIVLVGLYTGWLGWEGIRHGNPDHAACVDRPRPSLRDPTFTKYRHVGAEAPGARSSRAALWSTSGWRS